MRSTTMSSTRCWSRWWDTISSAVLPCGQVTATDYAHIIIACLFHDLGYVRGLFEEDGDDGFLIDAAGGKVTLPRGSSDAGLISYHVDRSKLYAMRRVEGEAGLNKQRIADAIEGTRFPPGKARNIVRRPPSSGRLISSGNSAISITSAKPTRSITSSKRSA